MLLEKWLEWLSQFGPADAVLRPVRVNHSRRANLEALQKRWRERSRAPAGEPSTTVSSRHRVCRLRQLGIEDSPLNPANSQIPRASRSKEDVRKARRVIAEDKGPLAHRPYPLV